MVDYLQARAGWEESVETLKRDTRRYAKRQLTWFRADADMHTASPQDGPQLENRIARFLQPENEGERP